MYLFPETEEQRKKRIAQGRLSLTDQFTRALASGTLDLGTTLGTGLTWAGFPELGEPVRKFFTEASSDYGPTPDIEGSIIDKPELLANPSWYVYNTAKFLPSQIPTMGAGAAAYAGMRGLGAGAKAAGIGAAATGGAVGGLMEGAGAYQAAKERGMSESEARRAGLGMAAGSAVLNSIPLARMFGPGTMLKRIGASAFSEGLTEAAEEPWQSLMTGEPVTEGLKRAVDVFIPAALGGGMGAVSVKPVVNRDYAKDTPTAKLMGDILKRSKSPDVDAFNEQAKQAYKAAVDAVGDAAVPRETIDQAVASELRPTFRKLLQATAKAEGLPEAAVMFSKAGEQEAAKPFYSAALKATEAIKQERGTPEQMLAQIKKTPGVKQEELDWIGLDQWMKEQKGPVTKQQIADFVRQNQVDVQEVQKGGAGAVSPELDKWIGENTTRQPQNATDWINQSSRLERIAQQWQANGDNRQASRYFDLAEEANRMAEHLDTGSGDTYGATKFSRWQLPGGKNYRELLLTLPEKPTSFKSGHFDEPNILAHVRFNDRTDADGKRVLFLEEVQSDWAQKGRKEGFSDKPATHPAGWENTNDSRSTGAGIQSAPFVTRTDSWSMLAMKRMLRYAAENGYDRIAWTTGDQQADRYDLSKQIDTLRVRRRDDGNYHINANLKDQSGVHVIDEAAPESKLPELVGKDLAEKITQQAGGVVSYSGVDLKVGGEGMRAFYDRMLPNELNKYVKKWGAKVGATDITKPETKLSFAELQRRRAGEKPDPATFRQSVHAIDITPQMRDSVMQGQPMFARTQQQAPGMADRDVQAIVDSLTNNWKNAPQVVVVPSMDYAPEYARRNASVRGGEAGVKGFFDENTGAVWIISSMARDAADVQRTLFHESFGHYGLRLLGDDAMPILRDVYARYKNDLADIARDYQLDLENSHEHRLLAAEEKLAQLAEAHKDTGLLNRVYAYIRRALRNMGWTSLKVSDAEIRDLLTRMAKGVREGNQSLEGGNGETMFQQVGQNQQSAPTLQGEDKYARPSSVNLNTLNSAEDVQALTRSMAKQFEGQVDEAKRGVMTVDEINRLAREIGEDPKFLQDFLTRKAGDAYSAEYLRAAQQLHRQSAQMTSKMIDEYLQKQKANQLSDSDRANMWEQIQRHALVLSQYSGVATEAGRALRILREDAQDIPGAQWKQREIDALIEGAGGRANLDGVVATIAAARDSGQANKALAKAVEATFFDKVIEAWINGLLSGPQTHAANAFSNALVQLMQDAEAFVAAGVGALHGGDKYLARQAVGRLKGWVPGVIKGMEAAGQALKSEEAVDLFGRLESGHRAAIEGMKGKVIRLPGRFLNASDMGFKALTISKYLAEQSAVTGRSVEELAADKKVMEKAWEDARYSTFTNDLGDIGKSVTALANRHPWMRFIMPFIRTPTNIVKFAAHRSPIGVMTPTFRAMWKEGGATRDVAVARVVMGSAVMATAAMLAKAGLLSGSGPEDPRKRATLRATGWAPYSINIGDTWYSFQRFEPLSMLLGIAADVAELNERMTDKEISDIAAMGAISFFSNITSKTYLRGLSDAFNAVTQPERYGSNWIAGYAGSAVPTGVAQLARMRDPYLREANGIMQKVQARIPVAREQLLKKRDVFGEPIANQGGVLFDTVPMYKSAVTRDVVAEELVRLDVRVSGVGSTIAKHKLTDEEQNQYEMFYGRLMKRMLEMRIRSPGWRNIPDAKKIEMIEDSTQEARKLARQMVVARNPTIMTR